ncbi:hypothetical protein MCP1_570007 [Candidatus Terasakiella magnetica]|nr:hypothetical protein MCP1_570007 [Candidatus Terasakiella magnetica]
MPVMDGFVNLSILDMTANTAHMAGKPVGRIDESVVTISDSRAAHTPSICASSSTEYMSRKASNGLASKIPESDRRSR